jgi:hypothetical protein
MHPPIPLQGTSCFFSSSIDADEFRSISTAQNYADVSSSWDGIVDWFCGTQREAAKMALFTLTHSTHDSLERVKAYHTLVELVPEDFKQFRVKKSEFYDKSVAWEFSLGNGKQKVCFAAISEIDPQKVGDIEDYLKAYSSFGLISDKVSETDKEAAMRALVKLTKEEETTSLERLSAFFELRSLLLPDFQDKFICRKKFPEDTTWTVFINQDVITTINRKEAEDCIHIAPDTTRTDNSSTASLFFAPDFEFSHRGDPVVWDNMSKLLMHTQMPQDRKSCATLLRACYWVAGSYFEANSEHGSWNSQWWEDRGIPILLGRFDHHLDQNFTGDRCRGEHVVATQLIPKTTTKKSAPILTYNYRRDPFAYLFQGGSIRSSQHQSEFVEPTKENLKTEMLLSIGITEDNIKAFAVQEAEALRRAETKDRIKAELVDQWANDPDFDHQKAKIAVKEIFGEVSDKKVLFMLRMFCITKPEFADFERNYQDLVKHLPQ